MLGPLLTTAKLVRWKALGWLPEYLRDARRKREIYESRGGETHIIFMVVDHFEPSKRLGARGVEMVREWCDAYDAIASEHGDSNGRVPQHSWFYRYDYRNPECVQILNEYVYRGLGEVEFHLHHGNDSPEVFERTIREGLEWFNDLGAMISFEKTPQSRFGYIAGNWALDNGRRRPEFSGVNEELSILGNLGCYADFTFPAFGQSSQPAKVNSIYYATDDPGPKSYDSGVDVTVGGKPSGDLMLIQGPLYVDWQSSYFESASFEDALPYFTGRLDWWLKAGVHVVGRPEWVFVKLHTHGMQSRASFLGDQLHRLLADLEAQCERESYSLHHVTAREAYNLVKAAEAGYSGDPGQYLDYDIKKPANRHLSVTCPYRLETAGPTDLALSLCETGEQRVEIGDNPIRSIHGYDLKTIKIQRDGDTVESLTLTGSGKCAIEYRSRNGGFGTVEVSLADGKTELTNLWTDEIERQ